MKKKIEMKKKLAMCIVGLFAVTCIINPINLLGGYSFNDFFTYKRY